MLVHTHTHPQLKFREFTSVKCSVSQAKNATHPLVFLPGTFQSRGVLSCREGAGSGHVRAKVQNSWVLHTLFYTPLCRSLRFKYFLIIWSFTCELSWGNLQPGVVNRREKSGNGDKVFANRVESSTLKATVTPEVSLAPQSVEVGFMHRRGRVSMPAPSFCSCGSKCGGWIQSGMSVSGSVGREFVHLIGTF